MLTAQSDYKICGLESASPARAGSPKTTWSIACRLRKLKKRFVQNPKGRARFAVRAEASGKGGLSLAQAFSLCGINMVRHLQAPPALMNSLIGNQWQR